MNESLIRRRFRHMQYCAKRYGKTVPAIDELYKLKDGLVDLKCPVCGIEMVWTVGRFDRSGLRSRVVTLQHDRSGVFKLICFSCNSRHQFHQNDDFYRLPAGMKPCAVCKRLLPLDAFAHDKSMHLGRFSNCRECEQRRYANYYARNAEKMREKSRRAYYKNREQVTAL